MHARGGVGVVWNVGRWGRAAVVGGLAGAVLTTGCDVGADDGPARPPSSTPVTILGSDTPPPPTPPWTLGDLVHHQCAVLGEADLTRYGFPSPGTVPDGLDFCSWKTPATAPTQVAMAFLPDLRHRYEHLEDAYRSERNFQTLTIAGRPAFGLDNAHDERNISGIQTCQFWVSVPSGGAIQFEYKLTTPGAVDENCSTATEIATAIAERVQ